MAEYREIYDRAQSDVASFWMEAASAIDWQKAPSQALDSSKPPFHRWFPDGVMNTCHNAVDRHVAAGRGDQKAVIYDSPITGNAASMSFSELQQATARFAGMLARLGVTAGDRVIIYMPMIPEAVVAMLGCARLGAVHSVVFGGFAAAELAKRIDDAQPKAIISASCGHEPNRIVAYKPLLDEAIELSSHKPDNCVIYQREALTADLVAGRDLEWNEAHDGVEELAPVPVKATDPLYILYTSGTTGPPKGVMITQYNIMYAVAVVVEALEEDDIENWRVISYLPMAHIAERVVGHYQALVTGGEVSTCPDPSLLPAYLGEVHPSLLFGVPRVFEKVYAGVNAALAADPERQKAFNDGVAAALEIKAAERAGTITQEQRDTWEFLDAVAFSQVRALVGMDELKIAITGAAPIPTEIIEWFNAIGVNLTEIYGLSETTGPLTFSPKANKPGFVGQICPGMEIKLSDEGEVLTRGGNIFQGYLKAPEKTAEVLDGDGWFHTGDIGTLDDEGYLKIVDRKKELIITSGGKNISPANLEAALKMIPVVGQACAIGDNRKFVSALLVLDPEAAPVWAAANGKEGMSLEDLANDPDVLAAVQAGVDEANTKFAQVEQIKKFVLLGEEWMPDSDLLTPTSKLKRRGVHAKYADEIESMYVDA